MEPAFLDPDVAAVDDRRDRRGVRRRPADAVLLERLDQRRLGEARRRLGEVLGRGDLVDAWSCRPRRARAGVPVSSSSSARVVVAALGVDPGEAVEQHLRRRGAQLVGAVGQLDRRRLELLGRHLRGERALPDEPVEAQLLGLERPGERVRVAPEAGRADRLVGLLGALRLGLVDAALGHRELGAVALADDLARLAHRDAGDRGRVGSHVGDEADLALAGLDRPRTAAGRSTSSACGLKPSLRLASCCRVEVVNGGAGERFWVRVPTLRHARVECLDGGAMALGRRPRRRRRAPRRRCGRARPRTSRRRRSRGSPRSSSTRGR